MWWSLVNLALPAGFEPACVQLTFHLVRSQRVYGSMLWSPWRESNSRPTDSESVALSTELQRRGWEIVWRVYPCGPEAYVPRVRRAALSLDGNPSLSFVLHGHDGVPCVANLFCNLFSKRHRSCQQVSQIFFQVHSDFRILTRRTSISSVFLSRSSSSFRRLAM